MLSSQCQLKKSYRNSWGFLVDGVVLMLFSIAMNRTDVSPSRLTLGEDVIWMTPNLVVEQGSQVRVNLGT